MQSRFFFKFATSGLLDDYSRSPINYQQSITYTETGYSIDNAFDLPWHQALSSDKKLLVVLFSYTMTIFDGVSTLASTELPIELIRGEKSFRRLLLHPVQSIIYVLSSDGFYLFTFDFSCNMLGQFNLRQSFKENITGPCISFSKTLKHQQKEDTFLLLVYVDGSFVNVHLTTGIDKVSVESQRLLEGECIEHVHFTSSDKMLIVSFTHNKKATSEPIFTVCKMTLGRNEVIYRSDTLLRTLDARGDHHTQKAIASRYAKSSQLLNNQNLGQSSTSYLKFFNHILPEGVKSFIPFQDKPESSEIVGDRPTVIKQILCDPFER